METRPEPKSDTAGTRDTKETRCDTRLDIEDCDKIADRFKIESLPTVVFLRGGIDREHECAPRVETGGAQFGAIFAYSLKQACNEAELETIRLFGEDEEKTADSEELHTAAAKMRTSSEELRRLALSPMESLDRFVQRQTREERGLPQIDGELPFDVSNHEAAHTAVAMSMLRRMRDAIGAFASSANGEFAPRIASLLDSDIRHFFAGDGDSEGLVTSTLGQLAELQGILLKLQQEDARVVQDSTPLIEHAANIVDLDGEEDPNIRREKLKFLLKRYAGQTVRAWVDYLFGVLLSTEGHAELTKINPYMAEETCDESMALVTNAMLRANRMGHTNRCIGACIQMEKLLKSMQKMTTQARLDSLSSLTPKLTQTSQDLAKLLTCGRHYVDEAEGEMFYNPRFMVFEFVWNILLRKKQVQIVMNLRESVKHGRSKVKQMINGSNAYELNVFDVGLSPYVLRNVRGLKRW
eukprot:scaffold2042_cov295-Pinguiococcus_pyrenoidosus.AAC.6